MKLPLKNWTNLDDRKAAYIAVVSRVMTDPDFRRNCLASDEFARLAFVEIGGIDVPSDVKIAFVPEGDRENATQRQSGSAIIEVPPTGTDLGTKEGLAFFRCTYAQWIGKTPGRAAARVKAKGASRGRRRSRRASADK